MTRSHLSMLQTASAAAIFALAAGIAPAQQMASKPDNSSQNANKGETAQSQSNAHSDRETTAKIRRAIIADKGLSLYAHNVKIITRNGTVTLKGPVKSADEKLKVESDAAGVVARGSLVDDLSVKQ